MPINNALNFPINASFYKYLLWYDNKYTGLTALKRTKAIEYSYSLN